MILCIDAGNTRIKWGLHPGAAQPARAGMWLAQGAVEVAQAHRLAALLPAQPVRRAVVANVAGEAAAQQIRSALAGRAQDVCWVVGRERQCGVESRYANPAQLGADRWAALIGARAAIGAGCDAVLECSGDPARTEAVLAETPPLARAAAARLAAAAHHAAMRRRRLDRARALAALDALLA